MILPREASPAPVSDPPAAPAAEPRAGLIRPPGEILDPAAVTAALDAAMRSADGAGGAGALRAAAVACLAEARDRGRGAILEALTGDPFAARLAVRSYSWLADRLVEAVFDLATRHLHPLPVPTEAERLSLLAVGGYGRGEMAPFSDVDLLFLTPWKITPWAESVIESVLYTLWDLKLTVGHSSRTVEDCLRLGRDDYTIRTSLLEHRHLAGDAALAGELHDRLWDRLFAGSAADFVEAKLEERTERHRKQGGQRYLLEPNVKEGKGGLRDLQSLYWIAKYVHRVESAADLRRLGVFTAEEIGAFDRAERFLWAVRCHLQLAAGRQIEQLTFDMQIEVAARLGYRDHGGRRAVEHFMQDYFLHATRVGELTRIFLAALEEAHVKRAPLLVALFRRRRGVQKGYTVRHNRLAIADRDAFLSDRLNLLRLFGESLRTGLMIHPDAMRLVSANLKLIDAPMRRDPEAARIFLDLLLGHGNPERALRRMNEVGVLAAFLPEFRPVVAMMQFNVYHRYTVDEHIIQTISTLAGIERGELRGELPVSTGIVEAGVNRRVLYLALLLHDIGKGRGEDHSILGARIARSVAPRLGLDREEVETVVWLVRHHLLMSDMAQKRDIADPRTVRDFAKAVRSRERLDLLTLVTTCDIRGVGPGVWNNWKAMLLRGLYRETADALEGGLADLNREKREDEARAALEAELADWDEPARTAEMARHYGPYWQGLATATQAIFARLLRGISDAEIRIDLHPDEARDATRACFALADHPGIFARLAGALALVGANVVDARTYTTRDGFATAVFWMQDGDGAPYDAGRLDRLRGMIDRTLKGEVPPREALADRDRLKKRERSFRFPTSITFDNDGSEIYTIVEVDTRDRPGLLHDVARTLSQAHISIASAVIATYGAQVVDAFYVKDMFGLKIPPGHKQASLERKLERAIAEGAARAGR